ncbi:MAG: hypothetical protein ACHQ50_06000 [Fimbriimonadales bacterium]
MLIADAGTPLMWGSCCMLVFGNFFIGLLEAWIAGRVLKQVVRPAWPIIANYASMSVGFFLVNELPLNDLVDRDPFRLGLTVIAVSWAVSFVLTILVEWPFFSIGAGEGLRFKLRVLKPTLVANAASYALLLFGASFLGNISALTRLHPAKTPDLEAPAGWVYYLDPSMKSVRRVRLDGGSDEAFCPAPDAARTDLSPSWGWTRLTFEARGDAKMASLYLRGNIEDVPVRKDLVVRESTAPPNGFDQKDRYQFGNLTFGYGSTASFSGPHQAATDFWPMEGLWVNGHRYALETPMVSIPWRSPTVLPGGQVIVCFGRTIFLIDPKIERAAKIAIGSGPAVSVDRPLDAKEWRSMASLKRD